MHCYGNFLALQGKTENWEQIYKVCRKKRIPITREDFDPVMHCAPGAAIPLVVKLYQMLTRKSVKTFRVEGKKDNPQYMNPTASTLMRDNEISRIADEDTRVQKAKETVEEHNEKTAEGRALAASLEASDRSASPAARRRGHTVRAETANTMAPRHEVAPLEVKEVEVKHLKSEKVQMLRARHDANNPRSRQSISETTRGVRAPALAEVDSLAKNMGTAHGGGGGVKPVADIMSALARGILKDHPEVLAAQDPRRPLFASYMQLSACAFPEAIFSFSETSPVFESVIFLLKRVAEVVRDADPALAQQVLLDVIIPQGGAAMEAAPGKRESLCEVFYAYAEDSAPSHLHVLRAIKDESLLDLSLYYVLVGVALPQPKVRVAALVILHCLAGAALTAERAGRGNEAVTLALLNAAGNLGDLSRDPWWEVVAQLLQCASALLELAALLGMRPDGTRRSALLAVVQQLLAAPGVSHNALQVGLSSLATNLHTFPVLIGPYVKVLAQQPPGLRMRLLTPPVEGEMNDSGVQGASRKAAYVMGSASRLYRENFVPSIWPSGEVAQVLVEEMNAAGVCEPEQLQILIACMPDVFEGEEASVWAELVSLLMPPLCRSLVLAPSHEGAAGCAGTLLFSEDEGVQQAALEVGYLVGRGAKVALPEALARYYKGLSSSSANVGGEVEKGEGASSGSLGGSGDALGEMSLVAEGALAEFFGKMQGEKGGNALDQNESAGVFWEGRDGVFHLEADGGGEGLGRGAPFDFDVSSQVGTSVPDSSVEDQREPKEAEGGDRTGREWWDVLAFGLSGEEWWNRPSGLGQPLQLQRVSCSAFEMAERGCPSWLFDYISFHKKMKGRADASYIVYACSGKVGSSQCGGLGDRFRGVFLALRLAQATGRVLLVHWDSPHSLEHFFSPSALDWRVTPELHNFVFEEPVRERYVDLPIHVIPEGVRQFPLPGGGHLDFSQPLEPQMADQPRVLILTSNIYPFRVMEIFGDQLEDVDVRYIRCVMQTLFQPTETLSRATDGIPEKIFGSPDAEYAAVHIRIGEIEGTFWDRYKEETPKEAAEAVLVSVLQDESVADLPVLVVSDSETLSARVASGEFDRCHTTGLRPVHIEKHGGPPYEHLPTFVEFLCLARASKLFWAASGFSLWAATLGTGSLGPTVMDEKCPSNMGTPWGFSNGATAGGDGFLSCLQKEENGQEEVFSEL
uniref:CH-like domain-containing protein n=1 Tax=Chromera velia CCMP2878 TaxID=1169474 RepID=A0A0G4IB68_9ALVE|eukprot:Cvel_12751.t1-p1 / transcript=Cvel_12751.t1 / gene=Cvel_12751 / organism=Chromera_velia_CCMP2878 / gene_product=hypothetical protein / transcript_product=hypothetical protein / location=Cvel_scaffold847:39412-52301(+) / protein_length=1199 / sequence_SO=supercontig / SO=protein_coding / is_pseudo=false